MLGWQIAVTLLIGFIFGFIASAASVVIDGTLKIDVDEDKDSYTLEVETPLEDIQKKRIMHLRVATRMLFDSQSQE